MRIFERKIWKFRSLLFRRLCWTVPTVRYQGGNGDKQTFVQTAHALMVRHNEPEYKLTYEPEFIDRP
jgi:hypothetical protein